MNCPIAIVHITKLISGSEYARYLTGKNSLNKNKSATMYIKILETNNNIISIGNISFFLIASAIKNKIAIRKMNILSNSLGFNEIIFAGLLNIFEKTIPFWRNGLICWDKGGVGNILKRPLE
jgi:hypothetical protein